MEIIELLKDLNKLDTKINDLNKRLHILYEVHNFKALAKLQKDI
jgi:hypothetical protein